MSPTRPLALVPCSAVGPRRVAVVDAVDGRRFSFPRRSDAWPWVEVEVLCELGPLARVRFRGSRQSFWVRSTWLVPIPTPTPETPR